MLGPLYGFEPEDERLRPGIPDDQQQSTQRTLTGRARHGLREIIGWCAIPDSNREFYGLNVASVPISLIAQIWWAGWDLNPHNLIFETSTYAIPSPAHDLGYTVSVKTV